ncbi:hypothetical protein [Clostridium sp. CF012]|uniref:hypothetical protein n=1 Tax=Clostridium sp. CF012 TaxID=2843319 RepID=UPI001C0B2C8C|nr:hypothetical protein [Clostridium sp. CF012]MBU3144693.1 hypothetical protein [Clostridium sp. CF012]
MNKNRPFIITFIGDISFLGALLSILIVLLPNFSERFGFYVIPLPIFSEGITQILLPIILLIASYGFLRLKRWGYCLMIIYTMFILIVSIIWCLQNKQLFFSQNIIMTFIQLIFIVPTRKYFSKKVSIS